ncbi:MAG: type II secretion system F family protein [Chloroflexota bacterium]
MIAIIGLLVAALAYILLSPPRVKQGDATRRLAEMYSLDTLKTLDDLAPSSLEYKLLASGLKLSPVTFRALTVGLALASAAAAWALLPGLPALIAGGVVFSLPYGWLDERVKGRGREIDRVLPVAVGRISAGLLAGGAVADVLQRTANSLNLERPNPLSPELELAAAELRSKARQDALAALAARSPSTSLANLAYLLQGYAEAGGGKYTEALLENTQRMQQLIAARNRAAARAADALNSARLLPLALGVVVVYLTRDPLIADALVSVVIQAVLAAAIGAMALGFVVMRSIISEAV